MKFILVIMVMLVSGSFASDINATKAKQLLEKQVQEQIEKEKKYSVEQTFYQGSAYDLKAAEVNPESLHSLPEIEDDDFNMDSVYD